MFGYLVDKASFTGFKVGRATTRTVFLSRKPTSFRNGALRARTYRDTDMRIVYPLFNGISRPPNLTALRGRSSSASRRKTCNTDQPVLREKPMPSLMPIIWERGNERPV
jgi:hypothetical protein